MALQDLMWPRENMPQEKQNVSVLGPFVGDGEKAVVTACSP